MRWHRSSSNTLRAEAGYSFIETLFVVGLIGVVAAIAAPTVGSTLASFRAAGDARSISNGIAVAKMRASSQFTQARLYVDLTTRQHHIELWQKTGNADWVPVGPT